MKKVIAALGLTDKATEDEAVEAIEVLKTKANEGQNIEDNLKKIAEEFVGGDKPSGKQIYLTRDGSAFEPSNLSLCRDHARRTLSDVWLGEADKNGEVVLTKL